LRQPGRRAKPAQDHGELNQRLSHGVSLARRRRDSPGPAPPSDAYCAAAARAFVKFCACYAG
jgi:hypothetical protein